MRGKKRFISKNLIITNFLGFRVYFYFVRRPGPRENSQELCTRKDKSLGDKSLSLGLLNCIKNERTIKNALDISTYCWFV